MLQPRESGLGVEWTRAELPHVGLKDLGRSRGGISKVGFELCGSRHEATVSKFLYR